MGTSRAIALRIFFSESAFVAINRITLNLALPSGRQKEFITRALNALAGTGDANRE
jgi:hypothetical protein